MSLDSDSVVNKIYKAVDDLNRLDKQRLEQWTAVLRRRPAEEVFNALISVFSNPLRERTRFLDQEYAGRLLLALKPPCPPTVDEVIRCLLPTWNVSIEQLPLYFEAVAGRASLLEALSALEDQPLSEKERNSIETFRYWLHVNELGC